MVGLKIGGYNTDTLNSIVGCYEQCDEGGEGVDAYGNTDTITHPQGTVDFFLFFLFCVSQNGLVQTSKQGLRKLPMQGMPEMFGARKDIA